MIFFGTDFDKSEPNYGVKFAKLKNQIDSRTKYTHRYIVLSLGHKRYWAGYNPLKRMVKGKLYAIDGKKLYFDGNRLSKKSTTKN